jgi:hypothetical protein
MSAHMQVEHKGGDGVICILVRTISSARYLHEIDKVVDKLKKRKDSEVRPREVAENAQFVNLLKTRQARIGSYPDLLHALPTLGVPESAGCRSGLKHTNS